LRGVVPPTFAEAVEPTEGDGDGGASARLVPVDMPDSLEPADVTLAAKAACCRSKKLAMVMGIDRVVRGIELWLVAGVPDTSEAKRVRARARR